LLFLFFVFLKYLFKEITVVELYAKKGVFTSTFKKITS